MEERHIHKKGMEDESGEVQRGQVKRSCKRLKRRRTKRRSWRFMFGEHCALQNILGRELQKLVTTHSRHSFQSVLDPAATVTTWLGRKIQNRLEPLAHTFISYSLHSLYAFFFVPHCYPTLLTHSSVVPTLAVHGVKSMRKEARDRSLLIQLRLRIDLQPPIYAASLKRNLGTHTREGQVHWIHDSTVPRINNKIKDV